MTFHITIETDDATAALIDAEAKAQEITTQALVERLAGKVVAGWAARVVETSERTLFDGLRVAMKHDPTVVGQVASIVAVAQAEIAASLVEPVVEPVAG